MKSTGIKSQSMESEYIESESKKCESIESESESESIEPLSVALVISSRLAYLRTAGVLISVPSLVTIRSVTGPATVPTRYRASVKVFKSEGREIGTTSGRSRFSIGGRVNSSRARVGCRIARSSNVVLGLPDGCWIGPLRSEARLTSVVWYG